MDSAAGPCLEEVRRDAARRASRIRPVREPAASRRARQGQGQEDDAGRIVWLDCLRALATLLVVWGHTFLVGLNDPATTRRWIPTIDGFVFGPDTVSRNVQGFWADALTTYTGVSVGGTGTAAFFLVSGFIILRTVDRTSPGDFLVRRCVRIFPVCAVAVVGTALLTALYCAHAGVPQPHDLRNVVLSSLALSDLIGSFATIPVLWTLSVEMAFYLLVAVLALATRRIEFGTIAAAALACLAFVMAVRSPVLAPHLSQYVLIKLILLTQVAVYVSFMLLGCVLYRGYSDNRPGAAVLYGTLVGALFLAGHLEFRARGGFYLGVSVMDAILSVTIFLLAFAAKPRGAWTAPLSRIADISYPLYLVHTPLGWGVLAWLGYQGLGMNAAGYLSIAAVMLVAWVLHVGVEQPSHRLGRWLSRRRQRLVAVRVAHPGPVDVPDGLMRNG